MCNLNNGRLWQDVDVKFYTHRQIMNLSQYLIYTYFVSQR